MMTLEQQTPVSERKDFEELRSPLKLSLSDVIDDQSIAALRAEGSCSRRILSTAVSRPLVSDFIQPIDIHLGISGDSTKVLPNMEGYPQRSLENAKHHLEGLLGLGIGRAFLRIVDDENLIDAKEPRVILDRHEQAVAALREQFPKGTLEITVDPFNEALNRDGRWGISKNRRLDYLETATVLVNVVDAYARAGSDYLLTLGRIEREVALAAATIKHGNYDTKVASFSTNVETTNAYAYLPDSISGRDTGQKLLNGNVDEMLIRAILDVHEGSQFVIIKPAENTYLINELSKLFNSPSQLREFLRSNATSEIRSLNGVADKAVGAILGNILGFIEKANEVQIGSYTVSGTYFADREILKRKGDRFMQDVLEERFANITASGKHHTHRTALIDRNAASHVAHLIRQEEA